MFFFNQLFLKNLRILHLVRPSARSFTFHIEGATFFKKGQPPGGLKQLNLEQNPNTNPKTS